MFGRVAWRMHLPAWGAPVLGRSNPLELKSRPKNIDTPTNWELLRSRKSAPRDFSQQRLAD